MKILQIDLIIFILQNRHIFKANYGEFKERELMLVKLFTDDGIGWGTCPTLGPYYSSETVASAVYIIKKVIGPRLLNKEINGVENYNLITNDIRGNYFAVAGIELALWDVLAKKNDMPLHKYIGGKKKEIECGYSLGMVKEDPARLIDKIAEKKSQGYKRIKIKITPGWDTEVVKKIRKEYSDLNLMVDCNAGYNLKNIDIFKELDKYSLDMIEQPLYHNDLYQHSLLQKQINTPVCLDESINSVQDILTAIELESCKIVNIKPFRVGGISKAKKINNICMKNKVVVWNGGMHESGVGTAFNMAAASLPNFDYPADIIPPEDLFHQDILLSGMELADNGTMKLSQKPGIGYNINENFLNEVKVKHINIK